MDHDLAIENRVRDGLLRLAKDLQIPLLATNDSHYVDGERTLRPRSTCSASTPGPRWTSRPATGPASGSRSAAPGYYLKSAAEMRALWDGKHGLREACDNTLLIAERCEVAFTEGNGTYMPRFPCPHGENEDLVVVRRSSAGLGPATPMAAARRYASGRSTSSG